MMGRRRFLVASSALAAACRPHAEPGAGAPRGHEVRDWEMPGDRRAVVLVPHGPKDRRYPLLIALHGMGETTSSRKGAYGWLESYALGRTLDRVMHPPLSAADYQQLVTPDRLRTVNEQLGKRPFGGLVIACPYLPRDVTHESYGRWLNEHLLPRLRAEAPILDGPASTGIDGVSYGGITALRIGLDHPELFGAIGSLQAAVVKDVDLLADLCARKLRGRPLRIVTSTEDAFRPGLEALGAELSRRAIPHELLVSEGPHDYVWNQGPGGIEMLVWHDRTLARA
jgi:enterochelin esterase-like enzyme